MSELEEKKQDVAKKEPEKVAPISADDLFEDEGKEEGQIDLKPQDTRVGDLLPEGWKDQLGKGGRTTILMIKNLANRLELLTWAMALLAAICLGGKWATSQYADTFMYLLFALISANIGFKLPNSKSKEIAKKGKEKAKELYEQTFVPKD